MPKKQLLNPLNKAFANARLLAERERIVDAVPDRPTPGLSFTNFLETGLASHKCKSPDPAYAKGEMLVLVDDIGCIVLVTNKGECYYICRGLERLDFGYNPEKTTYGQFLSCHQRAPVPDGQLIPSLYEDCVFDFISNGDGYLYDTEALFPDQTANAGWDKVSVTAATLSFSCLGMFDNRKGGRRGAAMLREGEVQILDWTSDERRPVSKSELKKLRSASPETRASVKPPELGFVAIGAEWHRSGNVLLKFGKQYLLFGVDEEAYFGCQLPGKANTVTEAFKLLMPKAAHGKLCPRQGEWFLEPVNLKNVPDITECVAYCLNAEDIEWGERQYDAPTGCAPQLCLPKKSVDSNTHFVTCAEWRVGKDGYSYALDPNLLHRDHEKLSVAGWVRFHENTAVQSFSIAGVD